MMPFAILLGGLGGVVPTLAKLAASYVTNPIQDLPRIGMYFGLLLFFVIGAIVVAAMKEKDLKQAFILGICAPAIITNIVSGATEERTKLGGTRATAAATQTPPKGAFSITDMILSPAYAERPSTVESAKSTAAASSPSSSALQSVRLDLQVSPRVTGAPDLRIYGIARDGSTIALMSTPASTRILDFSVPASVRVVGIASGGHAAHFILPPDSNLTAVTARVGLKESNDFLWALGAERAPSVAFIETKIAQPK